MAFLADEELSGVVPKQVQSVENQFEDIGYYWETDQFGRKIKKFGAIPKENNWNMKAGIQPMTDYSISHSSDPRKRVL